MLLIAVFESSTANCYTKTGLASIAVLSSKSLSSLLSSSPLHQENNLVTAMGHAYFSGIGTNSPHLAGQSQLFNPDGINQMSLTIAGSMPRYCGALFIGFLSILKNYLPRPNRRASE